MGRVLMLEANHWWANSGEPRTWSTPSGDGDLGGSAAPGRSDQWSHARETGTLSFGNVASAGLSEASIVADLQVNGSLPGGGGLGDVDLVYFPHIPPTPLPEDINEDGHVDHLDLLRLQHRWHLGWRD